MRDARVPSLAALWGVGIATAAAALAAVAGPPYLTASHLNGWILVFATALFAALFAMPFLLEHRLRDRIADRDDRWERAMVLWGAASAAVLVVAVLLGAAGSFAGDSWAGSIGLIATIEAGLVLGTLGAWVLSN
jgi:uncharacterized membrane protein